MKISNKKYAFALADVLETTEHPGPVVRSFLSLIRKRKQMKNLKKIVFAFEGEWRRRNNLLKVSVLYPEKFKDTVDALKRNLEAKTGKSLDIEAVPETGLIGGFRVKADDMLIDGSICGMLSKLKNKLTT